MKELFRTGLQLVFVILLCSYGSFAISSDPYHLKLLAVQESSTGELSGSDADVYLEVKEGSGRVFLDTYPATKMDTQISTRYAKDIACEFSRVDCSRFDFIYTIQAKTNIIGGPSAGAAVSAITAIALLDLPYNEDVAVTGTINSGGIIGPVGGIKQKIEAAASVGLDTVLIARGSANSSEFSNETNSSVSFDLVLYGAENLSISVVEVTTLEDVLYYVTGKNVTQEVPVIQKNDQYHQIMDGIRSKLCSRTSDLNSSWARFSAENLSLVGLNESQKAEAINESVVFSAQISERYNKSVVASERGDFYSAASFCFGINIELQFKNLEIQNISPEELSVRWKALEDNVTLFESDLGLRPINTISDLQAKMIVEERLNDVSATLLSSDKSIRLFSYALERFYTAQIWQDFFSMDGKKLYLDENAIKKACDAKIVEAQERLQYTELFLSPGLLKGIQEKLVLAVKARDNAKASLCLSIASQAKADSNAILTSIGLSEQRVGEFISSKQVASERVIGSQAGMGVFPILGYSYYEYAKTLSISDPFTSLVYMEYALELSDLSLYFPDSAGVFRTVTIRLDRLNQSFYLVFMGFGIGVLCTILVFMGLQYRAYKRKLRSGSGRLHWKKF